MHPSLEREVPDFLFDSIVYCDSLSFNKNEKSCLVLAKNLKFYEFRKKQLINCIDLSETCLGELKQQMMVYDGSKCKWFKGAENNESTSMQAESFSTKNSSKLVWQQSFANFEIKFAKFIYKSFFDTSKLYLLLNCWSKLVILDRSADRATGLHLIAEYDNVTHFKVVPSTIIKYSSMLKIHFADESSVVCTNFEKSDADKHIPNATHLLQQKREFKQLLERVRTARSELQIHKECTHKQFQSLKSRQTFGKNLVRSRRLDEKPMLTRCGDVWIRFTTSDELVIGVPLVNNCAPPNLTILKNLQPVILTNGATANTDRLSKSNNLNYDYRVLQLHQTFENLETLETFFQSQESQFEYNTWSEVEARILPTSFVVLLLKFNLSQLMMIEEKCQLFIRFQVEKDLEMNESKTHTFEQHLFIKTIDFEDFMILDRRRDNEIKFSKATVHQDFLALAMVCFSTHLKIKFATYSDRSKFEQLLSSKFDFEVVHHRIEEGDFNQATSMELDEQNVARLPCTLYYNRKPSSLWFGSLIMMLGAFDRFDGSETLETSCRFYNKNEEKSFVMFKLIFSDLITLKCNVVDIKSAQEFQGMDTRIVQFENALRQELSTFLELSNQENNEELMFEKMKSFMQLQYNTDILAAAQCVDPK